MCYDYEEQYKQMYSPCSCFILFYLFEKVVVRSIQCNARMMLGNGRHTHQLP